MKIRQSATLGFSFLDSYFQLNGLFIELIILRVTYFPWYVSITKDWIKFINSWFNSKNIFKINYLTFGPLISPTEPIPNKQVREFYNWQIQPEWKNVLFFCLIWDYILLCYTIHTRTHTHRVCRTYYWNIYVKYLLMWYGIDYNVYSGAFLCLVITRYILVSWRPWNISLYDQWKNNFHVCIDPVK